MMQASEIYQRYLGLIRAAASRGARDETARADVIRIMQCLDEDSRTLSLSHRRLLRDDLSCQLDGDALHRSNASTQAILVIALKHLEADAPP